MCVYGSSWRCVCVCVACLVLDANLRGDKCGLSLLAHRQGQTLWGCLPMIMVANGWWSTRLMYLKPPFPMYPRDLLWWAVGGGDDATPHIYSVSSFHFTSSTWKICQNNLSASRTDWHASYISTKGTYKYVKIVHMYSTWVNAPVSMIHCSHLLLILQKNIM